MSDNQIAIYDPDMIYDQLAIYDRIADWLRAEVLKKLAVTDTDRAILDDVITAFEKNTQEVRASVAAMETISDDLLDKLHTAHRVIAKSSEDHIVRNMSAQQDVTPEGARLFLGWLLYQSPNDDHDTFWGERQLRSDIQNAVADLEERQALEETA